jgi:peptidoglycan-N-acetylglucosamine deacetylase
MGTTRAEGRALAILSGLVLAAALTAAGPANGQAKKVRLTFDDGPEPGTAAVLDVLKELKAPATFFLTGSNKSTLPGGEKDQKALVQRMLDEGHAVGNHVYTHKPSREAEYKAEYGELKTEAQKKKFRKNLDDNLDHFRRVLGKPDLKFTLARLPGDGRKVAVCVREVQALGLTHLAWDFEFAPNGQFAWVPHNDWQGIKGAAASHKGLPGNGDIILFHDRHWDGARKATLKAVLTKLQGAGYTFEK